MSKDKELLELQKEKEFKTENPSSAATEAAEQPYDVIVLIGEETPDEVEIIKAHLKKKEIESGGRFRGVVFGDGNKITLNDLLEDDKVQAALRNTTKQTLTMISAHGGRSGEAARRTHGISDYEFTTEMLDDIRAISPNIQNIKLFACHIGTNSRAIIKSSRFGAVYKGITQDILIYEDGDSKYPSLQSHTIQNMLDSIDLRYESVMMDYQSQLLTMNEREMIISALRNPASIYLNNHGDGAKLDRLFRDTPKDQNGDYIVTPDTINAITLKFISDRVEDLIDIFLKDKKIDGLKATKIASLMESEVDNLARHEIKKGLIENLKNKFLDMYAYRGTAPVVKALLKSGVDVNHQDINGDTQLMLACEKGKFEIVKLLLDDPKTDPTIKNRFGITPLKYLIANQKYDIAILIALKARDYAAIKNIMSSDQFDLKIDPQVKAEIMPLQDGIQASPEEFKKLCEELRDKKGYGTALETKSEPSTSIAPAPPTKSPELSDQSELAPLNPMEVEISQK